MSDYTSAAGPTSAARWDTAIASRRRPVELIALGADRPEGGDGELVKAFWTD